MDGRRGVAVVGRPVRRAGAPVRETAHGTWFHVADGRGGALLRLPAGADATGVRRLRRLALPGLLPIDTVVEDDGRVWLATPLPPGPTVADLLGTRPGLGSGDAAAVLRGVGRALRALHARGMGHGALDADAVLLAPDGAPVLVGTGGSVAHREQDLAGWAKLAWALADAWCPQEPAHASDLRGCADLAEAVGLGAALGALPFPSGGERRRRAAELWTAGAA